MHSTKCEHCGYEPTLSEQKSRAETDFQRLMGNVNQNVEGMGPEFTGDPEKLCFLRDRLEENRFHLAVLEQFKTGRAPYSKHLPGEAPLPTRLCLSRPKQMKKGDRNG